MKKRGFEKKPRTRIEFCRLFLDDSYSDNTCYYWLNNEINSHPELKSQLEKVGYKKGSHYLTIPQQSCIFEYFGIEM